MFQGIAFKEKLKLNIDRGVLYIIDITDHGWMNMTSLMRYESLQEYCLVNGANAQAWSQQYAFICFVGMTNRIKSWTIIAPLDNYPKRL